MDGYLKPPVSENVYISRDSLLTRTVPENVFSRSDLLDIVLLGIVRNGLLSSDLLDIVLLGIVRNGLLSEPSQKNHM